MRFKPCARVLALALLGSWGLALQAQEAPLGGNVEALLDYARSRNPEYAAMRHEAERRRELERQRHMEPHAHQPRVPQRPNMDAEAGRHPRERERHNEREHRNPRYDWR